MSVFTSAPNVFSLILILYLGVYVMANSNVHNSMYLSALGVIENDN